MSFILDASVACAWVFADETTPALDALLDDAVSTDVIVPSLWRSEVLNTLVQASRRGRITTDQILAFWGHLGQLGITESSYSPSAERIVALCQKHSLTAYDAWYLDLAVWSRLPLATLDRQLVEAAEKEGVTVLGA